jgi:hypothetical protein
MKTFALLSSHITATIGVMLLLSCDGPTQKNSPDLPSQTPAIDAKRETESPSSVGHPPAKSPDLDQILSNARKVVAAESPRQAAQVIRDLPYYHDPKVCAAMIEMLDQQVTKLPKQLPSLAEVQAMEIAGRTHPELWTERWLADFGKVANLVFCLVELGFPEGITAAENTYEKLASQWGDTEASRPLLNALRSEMDNAHYALKQGTAKWQRSPNAPIRLSPLNE